MKWHKLFPCSVMTVPIVIDGEEYRCPVCGMKVWKPDGLRALINDSLCDFNYPENPCRGIYDVGSDYRDLA